MGHNSDGATDKRRLHAARLRDARRHRDREQRPHRGPDVPHLAPARSRWGWGHVEGSQAPAIAQGALTGELPEKPLDAVLYMQQLRDTRNALWGTPP